MSCCRKIEPGSFQPDYLSIPLTEKFYARHESLEMLDPRRTKVKTSHAINKGVCYDPEIYKKMPKTENQVYGWLETQTFEYDEACPKVILPSKFRSQALALDVIDKHADVIGKRMNYDAREHHAATTTENQEYGWLEKLGVEYHGLDKRMYYHPRLGCEELRVQLLIFQEMHRNRKLGLAMK